jgi:hypothetical protein
MRFSGKAHGVRRSSTWDRNEGGEVRRCSWCPFIGQAAEVEPVPGMGTVVGEFPFNFFSLLGRGDDRTPA